MCTAEESNLKFVQAMQLYINKSMIVNKNGSVDFKPQHKEYIFSKMSQALNEVKKDDI